MSDAGPSDAPGNPPGDAPEGLVYQEFPIPTVDSMPGAIVAGSDGNVWFTEAMGRRIGRVTPRGVITEFPVAGEGPQVLALGPDGAVWYGAHHSIGRVTPAGAVTEYSFSSLLVSTPGGITVGPDGNLWLPQFNAQGVVRMSPQGVLSSFPLTHHANLDIVSAPDGHLWFISRSPVSGISRISTEGQISEVVPANDADVLRGATSMIIGPDGEVWVALVSLEFCYLARVTTQDVTFLNLPWRSFGGCPTGIARGPDGNLWVAENGLNVIRRVTLLGEITDFPLPGDAGPSRITAGPDGYMWITNARNNSIGRLSPNLQAATPRR